MSLMMAKCPYCGQTLEVDSNMPAAICSYCGHPFVTEQAVKYYAQAANLDAPKVVNRELDADFVIEGDVLVKYKGKALDVVVPKGIRVIKGGCFARQNIRSVHLPDEVEELASESAAIGAFSGCTKLVKVNLPASLRIIGDSSFSGCTALDEFILPDGREGFILPDGLEVIGAHAFEACQRLDVMEIPTSVMVVKPYAFARCYNLKKVRIPEHITEIGSFMFFSCLQLCDINISHITKIADNAFNGCIAFTAIELPEGLVTIGEYGFKGCTGLTEITLPETLTALGAGAFDSCNKLTKIRFPEALLEVGTGAFRVCSCLTEVEFTSEDIKLGDDVFEECLMLKESWQKAGLCRECGGERSSEFLSYVCHRCGRKSLTKFG